MVRRRVVRRVDHWVDWWDGQRVVTMVVWMAGSSAASLELTPVVTLVSMKVGTMAVSSVCFEVGM